MNDLSIQDIRNDISSKGLFFGSRWWLGQQNNDFYAIDVVAPSYYVFQSGVNATLGEDNDN